MFTTFKKYIFLLLLITLPLCGVWQIGQGAYIHSKAFLAQILLEAAWAETLRGDKEVRPWPWADTWPVSRLTVPSLGISRIVLAGASGASLAFGPGHLFGTAEPGNTGYSIIAGHRDTHFRFLEDIKADDLIVVQSASNSFYRYQVSNIEIIDETEVRYFTDTHDTVLILVTCYPFDAIIPGGSLRYIVIARPVAGQHINA